MTEAEKLFWSKVRNGQLGCKFRRQVPIDSYIADFICFERRLVIELDGGQHALEKDRDEKRTNYLEKQGYTVLRFWNNDILGNIDGTLESLMAVLSEGDKKQVHK